MSSQLQIQSKANSSVKGAQMPTVKVIYNKYHPIYSSEFNWVLIKPAIL